MQEGPIVVGVPHQGILSRRALLRASSKIEGFLTGISGVKTVFLETGKGGIPLITGWLTHENIGLAKGKNARYYKKFGRLVADLREPFEVVFAIALNKGWEIKPLERELIRGHSLDTTLPVQREYDNRIREKSWAGRIKRNLPSEHQPVFPFYKTLSVSDLVIMHPGHVRGFVSNCRRLGVFINRVIMISRFVRPSGITEQEIDAFKILRSQSREKRIQKNKAVKERNQLHFRF